MNVKINKENMVKKNFHRQLKKITKLLNSKDKKKS